MTADREQTRRDAEEWIDRTLVDSSAWAKVVADQAESIIARLDELEQAERERDEWKFEAERPDLVLKNEERLREAETRLAKLVKALRRISERQDVDMNGEYIIRGQPVLSASMAAIVAEEALTAYEQKQA